MNVNTQSKLRVMLSVMLMLMIIGVQPIMSQDDVTTIRWVQWWDNAYGEELMDEIIAGFEAENPDVNVERVFVPWNNMYDSMVTNAQLNVADYDLLGMEVLWMVGLDRIGGIAPLDEFLGEADEEWLAARAPGSQVTWRGDTKLIYWYMFPYTIAYNIDMLEEAGVEAPTNWEEFTEAACALRNEENDVYGFSMSMAQQNFVVWGYLGNTILQLGGEMFDENGRAVFNSPEGVEAMERWQELYESGCVAPGSLTETGATSREYFATGRTAMVLDGPFIGGLSQNVNPDIQVGFLPAWSEETGGYVWLGSGLAIAENSDNKEETWRFMEYLLGEELSLELTEIRSVPYSTNAAFEQLVESEDPILSQIPNYLYQDPENNISYDPFPNMVSNEAYLMGNLQQAFDGRITIQEALDDAAAKWNEDIEAMQEAAS